MIIFACDDWNYQMHVNFFALLHWYFGIVIWRNLLLKVVRVRNVDLTYNCLCFLLKKKLQIGQIIRFELAEHVRFSVALGNSLRMFIARLRCVSIKVSTSCERTRPIQKPFAEMNFAISRWHFSVYAIPDRATYSFLRRKILRARSWKCSSDPYLSSYERDKYFYYVALELDPKTAWIKRTVFVLHCKDEHVVKEVFFVDKRDRIGSKGSAISIASLSLFEVR